MPAPTFQAIYDFPGNVASAWGSILSADLTTLIGTDTHATNTAFLFGPRDNSGSMPVDRIGYTASGFTQASNQQVVSTGNGAFWFSHYAGQIQTTIHTPRSIPVAAAMHGARVGRVLFLAQSAAQRFTSSNLPYYAVASLTLANAPRAQPAEDEDCDVTDILHEIHLWIKPDAFPSSIP